MKRGRLSAVTSVTSVTSWRVTRRTAVMERFLFPSPLHPLHHGGIHVDAAVTERFLFSPARCYRRSCSPIRTLHSSTGRTRRPSPLSFPPSCAALRDALLMTARTTPLLPTRPPAPSTPRRRCRWSASSSRARRPHCFSARRAASRSLGVANPSRPPHRGTPRRAPPRRRWPSTRHPSAPPPTAARRRAKWGRGGDARKRPVLSGLRSSAAEAPGRSKACATAAASVRCQRLAD